MRSIAALIIGLLAAGAAFAQPAKEPVGKDGDRRQRLEEMKKRRAAERARPGLLSGDVPMVEATRTIDESAVTFLNVTGAPLSWVAPDGTSVSAEPGVPVVAASRLPVGEFKTSWKAGEKGEPRDAALTVAEASTQWVVLMDGPKGLQARSVTTPTRPKLEEGQLLFRMVNLSSLEAGRVRVGDVENLIGAPEWTKYHASSRTTAAFALFPPDGEAPQIEADLSFEVGGVYTVLLLDDVSEGRVQGLRLLAVPEPAAK